MLNTQKLLQSAALLRQQQCRACTAPSRQQWVLLINPKQCCSCISSSTRDFPAVRWRNLRLDNRFANDPRQLSPHTCEVAERDVINVHNRKECYCVILLSLLGSCMSLWISNTVANKLYTLGETVYFYSTTTTTQTHLLHDSHLFTYKMPRRNKITNTSWISKPLYFHYLIFHSSSHKRMYMCMCGCIQWDMGWLCWFTTMQSNSQDLWHPSNHNLTHATHACSHARTQTGISSASHLELLAIQKRLPEVKVVLQSLITQGNTCRLTSKHFITGIHLLLSM